MRLTGSFSSRLVALLIVGAVPAACGGTVASSSSMEPASPSPEASAPAQAAELPAGHPMTRAGSLEASESAPTAESATVLELLEGGGYTYARLAMDDGEREVWVAGPQTALDVGEEVRVGGLPSMGSFSSAALERTFEDLYFVGAFGTSRPPAGAATEPPAGATTGQALEVLEGGGYTYVRLQIEDGEVWLAGPATRIAEGDSVSWWGGLEMGEFTSSSLERTFEAITFVERYWVH